MAPTYPDQAYPDKEVEGYYEAGLQVPEDVTLLWTDDKYGKFCS